MATIKKEEYPIKDNGFEYLGKHYDCLRAIERDMRMIIQEAEASHKDTFDEFYDRNTLRANKIRIFVDGDNIPIYLNLIIQCFSHTRIKKAFVGNMIMATIKSYTDIEQSRKLAEILPPENADMKWYFWKSEIDAPKTPTFGYSKTAAESYKDTEVIYLPCWSLASLLSVLPEGTNISIPDTLDKVRYSCWNDYDITYASNPIDACCEMILKLHELNLL